MVGIGRRDTIGTIEVWKRILLRTHFCLLDSPFDIADRFQVLVNPIAITRSKRLLKANEFFIHGIEQTRSLFERGAAISGPTLFAEQVFEHDPRMSFRR